eukprot:SAG31_NODE_373_length_16597_cov_21.519518_7_plen_158_part_00
MRANSTRVAPAEPAEPASTSGENSSPLAVDPTELAVTAAVVAQRSAHRLRATAKSAHALLTEVKHQSSCVPQQLFAKLDKDQNGYLSIVEYEKLGTSLNGALRDAFSSGELKSMFKQMVGSLPPFSTVPAQPDVHLAFAHPVLHRPCIIIIIDIYQI